VGTPLVPVIHNLNNNHMADEKQTTLAARTLQMPKAPVDLNPYLEIVWNDVAEFMSYLTGAGITRPLTRDEQAHVLELHAKLGKEIKWASKLKN
jgi:hypothetical protein